MIEGQNGLTWARWQRIVRAVEDLGFAGLYRSDHFTNMNPPDLDSLELWVSLTWLAANTKRIAFGPLVTPLSFRHPVMTLRMATAVDDLSGGRLTLGLGAGWQVREHANYGFELLDVRARFARFREGLQIITRLLQRDEPPILIGGSGPLRTLPLAARYAAEWNGTFQTPEKYKALNHRLNELLTKRGRRAGDVRRSLMTGLVFGRTEAEVEQRLRGRSRETLRDRGVVIGTPPAVAEHLGRLQEAGVQRVMLQWLELDDLAGLEALARAVVRG